MKLLTLFFTNLLAFFLVTRVRQVVAVTLVGAVAFTVVAPPAKAVDVIAIKIASVTPARIAWGSVPPPQPNRTRKPKG